MGDVVHLRQPVERWASGMVRCLACTHEWSAAFPIPHASLECPSCGCHTGASKNPFSGPDDYAIWTCKCGNTLMELFVDTHGNEELMCIGCGRLKE